MRLLAGMQYWSYYSWRLTSASPKDDDLATENFLLPCNTT